MRSQDMSGTGPRAVFAMTGLVMLACLSLMACDRSQQGADGAARRDGRPNVVVIVADGLGTGHVSAYGGAVMKTPHIDSIAQDGALFRRGYSAAAVSGPALAALISGRYPQRFGYEFDNGPALRDARNRLGLPPAVRTLGDEMQKAGYRTMMVGKWHLGGNTEYYPTKRGFDDFFGILSGETAYITPRAKTLHFAATEDQPLPPARDWYNQLIRGPASQHVLNEEDYLTDALTDAAVKEIEKDAEGDKPFFLYLSYTAPNKPLEATDKYYRRFTHVKDEKERVYLAMIAALDDGVGRVLDALEKTGQADDTIVVFLSANGCDSALGVCPCEPLRGGRVSFYEGGVRVPFLMRWPGRIPAGIVYDQPVSTIDVMPTLLIAADPTVALQSESEGVDLMPYVSGAKSELPHKALFWQSGLSRAVLDDPWKLWILPDGDTLLFNLNNDPNEANNIADSNRDVVRSLENQLLQWRQANVSPRWTTRGKRSYNMCGVDMELTE